jgi:hypothetical protein
MPFWNRIQNIPIKYLYVALFVAILLPIVFPFRQKMTPSAFTKAYYDSIEALKPGDVVVLSIDQTPSTLNEIGGGSVAAITHLKSKGAKIIFWAIYFSEGAPIYETRLASLMKDKKYGDDYVNFGYIVGKEATAEVLGKDMRSLLKTDAYGKSIDELPLMKNIRSAKDVALLITTDDGGATVMWIQQWTTPYKTKVISSAVGANVALLIPYTRSGQLMGLLASTTGVAEYETMLNAPGIGIQQMGSITSTNALMLLVMALGIIGYIGEKVKGNG